MEIQVVIVRRGSNQPIENWYEPDTPNYLGQIKLHDDKWEKSTCHWPTGILDGTKDKIDIFLCLDEEALSDGYEIPTLKKLIVKAHSSMWLADLYIVVSNRMRIKERSELMLIRKWFDTLLDNYISDVLELDLNSPKIHFQSAVVRAEERSDALYRNISRGRWECFIDSGMTKVSPDIGFFLEDFLTDNLYTSNNCLLVLRNYRDKNLKTVRIFLQSQDRNYKMVGLLNNSPLFPEVKKLCEVYRCPVIEFRGLFELYYFLQKLNEPLEQSNFFLFRKPIVPQAATISGNRSTRQLLITHSFDSNDQIGYVNAAADVWTLQKELGKDLQIVIHPAVQIENFPKILADSEDLLAWIHIGHGDEENGLQEAGGIYRKDKEWLSCFAGYRKKLAIAIFLSCHSHLIARKFSQAAVDLAIGFENQLPKNLCGSLAVEVVKAALESNVNRDRILEVFDKKKLLFEDALPIVFQADIEISL